MSERESFDLYPALDLLAGRVVRLRNGERSAVTEYSADPVDLARRLVRDGARRMHVVDLDGAFGEPSQQNALVIAHIRRECQVFVQVGGGLRSESRVAEVLGWGVDRVVLGTLALESLDAVARLCARHPGRVAVGLDVKHGRAAHSGWTATDARPLEALAAAFAGVGVDALVVTDISRDGTLAGPDPSSAMAIGRAARLPVIVSGGVSTLADLERLRAIGAPIRGAIVGKALLEGRFAIADALRTTGAS